MHKASFLLFCGLGLLVPRSIRSQDAQERPRSASNSAAGRWVVTSDFYGTTFLFSLELKQDGDKLTGDFDGDKLEGTIQGGSIHFLAKDEQGGTEECTAKVQGDTMSGALVFANADDTEPPGTHQFTAKIVPQRKAGP